ncbi:L-serine ammonia-lyase, iron-sulfur-dependent, subunit alpha [uncultured Marinococcus sp.]|uniref:L-serine ammonia-lyase, iron-sulfur-dependent, subunit alpha n=1 Tax=uncultured Marinococcus sp. TaxID=487012 RepID=UPI00263095A9|nr:L-serine ammonia-lyase, iron-sulfur-dependent, subunit alpha [uncultured Marinococcus sp.]
MTETMKDIVAACQERGISLGEWMIQRETERTGGEREKIFAQMQERLSVMKEAVAQGINDLEETTSKLSGGDAYRMHQYNQTTDPLSGPTISKAMEAAMATSESNAKMNVIVATPTAGSAGILPGIMISLQENHHINDEALTMGLFAASAIGYVFANHAFVSGAAGGCQAEVGSATAMAAGTITELRGGAPAAVTHAVAMAMKSLLGLVCDPVGGLVEVPCVKRNVIGTSIAFSAADMALAGIESRIPCDEVIHTMHTIGKDMPGSLKETAEGGLAQTPTGLQAAQRVYQRPCNL